MLYKIKYYLHSPTTSYQKIITPNEAQQRCASTSQNEECWFLSAPVGHFPKTSPYFIHIHLH